ncbi:MAG: hypothetical protein IPL29_03525 [Propionivibrio sp.]|nr:hypothetical protein [Propionivibrio sp.]
MENLLAEELATEKMRDTPGGEGKQVGADRAVESQADKVRAVRSRRRPPAKNRSLPPRPRQKRWHVLPFKQKQIEQRGLEAGRPRRSARIKNAEAIVAGTPDRGHRRGRIATQAGRMPMPTARIVSARSPANNWPATVH